MELPATRKPQVKPKLLYPTFHRDLLARVTKKKHKNYLVKAAHSLGCLSIMSSHPSNWTPSPRPAVIAKYNPPPKKIFYKKNREGYYKNKPPLAMSDEEEKIKEVDKEVKDKEVEEEVVEEEVAEEVDMETGTGKSILSPDHNLSPFHIIQFVNSIHPPFQVTSPSLPHPLTGTEDKGEKLIGEEEERAILQEAEETPLPGTHQFGPYHGRNFSQNHYHYRASKSLDQCHSVSFPSVSEEELNTKDADKGNYCVRCTKIGTKSVRSIRLARRATIILCTEKTIFAISRDTVEIVSRYGLGFGGKTILSGKYLCSSRISEYNKSTGTDKRKRSADIDQEPSKKKKEKKSMSDEQRKKKNLKWKVK